jgi:large subunit ribosomal protein L3
MPSTKNPRSGSMQFWPRVRAKRHYARVRHPPQAKEAKIQGFAGYKAGMTHIMFTDSRKNASTKGETVSFPVTVVECPPIKVYGVRFYNKGLLGIKAAKDIVTKSDKELARKIPQPKKEGKLDGINPDDYTDIKLLVYTQPKLTGIGKKKPEIFEMHMGGSLQEKLAYAKDHLGKEIFLKDIFKEGDQVDLHVVTKGKGFQGAVKRFGIHRKPHKSEKTRRAPGTLGGWVAQGHFMYRVPHAGSTGYNQRIEYNKLILKIGEKPEDVNPAGGFLHYGLIKNNYLLIKGSVGGPANRIVRMSLGARPNPKFAGFVPDIKSINQDSKQGR